MLRFELVLDIFCFCVRDRSVLGLSWRYRDENWSVAKMVIVGFPGISRIFPEVSWDFHGLNVLAFRETFNP